MTAEEKHDNFVRLAEKRIETVQDAIRIFSNLSGPSYEWSPDEVLAYFDRLQASIDEALGRFKEQKKWREQGGADGAPRPAVASAVVDTIPDYVHNSEPELADDETPQVETLEPAHAENSRKERRRNLSIGELIADAQQDSGVLANTIVLQREVIERQEQTIAELRR